MARVRAGERTAEHWSSCPKPPVPRKDDLAQRDLELEGPGVGPDPVGAWPRGSPTSSESAEPVQTCLPQGLPTPSSPCQNGGNHRAEAIVPGRPRPRGRNCGTGRGAAGRPDPPRAQRGEPGRLELKTDAVAFMLPLFLTLLRFLRLSDALCL